MHGSEKIKVTVRIPEKLPEAVRQRKINKIYDILTEKSRAEVAMRSGLWYTTAG